MFESVMQKHVSVSLANGQHLEGFTLEKDEIFIKIVEPNNDVLIVRISDVSYIRILGARHEKFTMPKIDPEYTLQEKVDFKEPECTNEFVNSQETMSLQNPKYANRFEFSMSHPATSASMPVSAPKFERKT
jgi:hypothetical protein